MEVEYVNYNTGTRALPDIRICTRPWASCIYIRQSILACVITCTYHLSYIAINFHIGKCWVQMTKHDCITVSLPSYCSCKYVRVYTYVYIRTYHTACLGKMLTDVRTYVHYQSHDLCTHGTPYSP